MGYAINPAAIFDFANHTTHTDQYLFTKNTYMNARDYAPDASTYAQAESPAKSKKASSTKGRSSYYTIRRGDTLSRIADYHRNTVIKLCKLNGLKTTPKLNIGKKLRIN